MKVRKIVIFVLTAVLILMVGYCVVGMKDAAQVMKEENLEIVEAPKQTEAEEHPDFIVEYVPVVLEGTNAAADGKVKADSFVSGYPANKAIDGKTEGSSYWEGGSDAYPNNLTLDLKEEKEIHAIRLCVCPQQIWGKRTQTFAVYIGNDEENLTEWIPETDYVFDPDMGNEVVLEFEPVNTQYVRLVFTGNTGAHGGQVAEFEVYTK